MLQLMKTFHCITGGGIVSRYDTFFEEICEKYYKDIYKYIVFVLKDRDISNDIVQDTFIVVYKNIEKVYNHENPGGFVFRTAQNLVKNYKKELYKRLINEVNIDDGITDIRDLSTSIENSLNAEINEYEYITDIIDSLSDDKKRLYKMYYIEKKSMKEIAASEGIEYTALRMKYVRLRKEIKNKVREFAENNFVT